MNKKLLLGGIAFVLVVVLIANAVGLMEEQQEKIEPIEFSWHSETLDANKIIKSVYDDVYIIEMEDKRIMHINKGAMGAMNIQNRTETLEDWKYIDCLINPLLLSNANKDVLSIGLGAGIIPVKIEANHPNVSLDVVEINPAVIKGAREYFGVRETDQIKIIEDDGRMFLKYTDKKYDVIILDAYKFEDGYNVPAHLTTKEFFELLKTRLKPGGTMTIMMLSERRNLIGTDFYKSLHKTIDSTFQYSYMFDCGFQIMEASDTQRQYSLTTAGEQYTFKSDMRNAIIFTDDFAPINPFEKN